MNISEIAIRRPVPFIVLFILLSFAGLYAFNKIEIKNFPDMDFPTVTVSISLSGATPEQLETQITRKVEDSVTNIDSIKHINSTVSDGNSTTTIEFNLGKNLQEATDDVKDAINKIQSQFPPGTTTPVVSRVNIGDGAILTYEIDGNNIDTIDLSWLVDNEINKLLLSVPGVGKITRQGGVDREVQVLISPTKLISMNTTINNISNQLYAVRQDFSGGRANIGSQEQTIQGVENINSAADLANLTIPLGNTQSVRLGNIAEVRDTSAEVRQMAFLDGNSITSFQVYPSKGSSELAVANLVRAQIAQFKKKHTNIHIKEISNTVQPIKDNYDSSMNALYEGCILAIAVVWLFLRDWRATFIAATALPLSIIPTFLFIYWLGFSLNLISLLSLSLVIGVLVDDAIVEVENITRHIKYTSSPFQAAINAAAEIGNAVIATSFTLIAVFLPTAFMGGIPGRIFKQFGWTAVIAIFLSLMVARLLTPMMAAHFMKPSKHKDNVENTGKIMQRYIKMVGWCIEHRRKTLLITAGFFITSLMLLVFIPNTFFPAEESNQIQFSVQVPPGSKIDVIAAVLKQSTQQTKDIKSISSVYATIGNGVKSGEDIATDNNVTKGTLTFNLIEERLRPHHQTKSQLEKLIQARLKKIPGARFSGEGGNGERYSISITGDDKTLLNETAKKLEKELRGLKNIGNISSDFDLSRPEVKIRPDFNKAAKFGVTSSSIGEVIRIATAGDYSNNLAKIDLPDRQIPIMVRVEEKATQSLEKLGNLRVSGSSGTIPLASVAKITLGNGPVNISRIDRNRVVTFNIDLQGRNLSELDREVRKLPTMKRLPNGINRLDSGDIERMQEMFSGFIFAMLAGIICVYFVLAILFDDFKQPITILSALPLAVGGALGSLVLFGYSLSMPSLIGILMLMGVVTKNSILLVDYIIISKKSGNSQTAAIIDACTKRVRPIIMTTIAMIAGMIPVALGIEGDSSFRAPMAVTVIAGLITSTALSLLVVPVIFDVIDNFKFGRQHQSSAKTSIK